LEREQILYLNSKDAACLFLCLQSLLGEGAGHGWAEEDVDAEHEQEEHPEDYAEP